MVDTTKPTLSAFQLTVIVVVVVFSLNFRGSVSDLQSETSIEPLHAVYTSTGQSVTSFCHTLSH